jgi:hypothetical protein
MSHSNLPSPLPLSQFEVALQVDQRVLGVLYTGSLGRGTADRFSDLDMEMWLTDAAYAEGETTVREILGMLGAIQFLYLRYAGDSSYYTAFLEADWLPVDLAVHRPTVERPLPPPAQVRLLKDRTQHLERLLAEARVQPVVVSWEEARVKIEDAIDYYIYLNRKNADGDGWCALGLATESAAKLYTLLAALRGWQAYVYRYTTQVLSPQERALLAQVWPMGPSKPEMRRASRALWNWTRLVWQEAERRLGRSLLIEVDEASLLTAVDRLYSG